MSQIFFETCKGTADQKMLKNTDSVDFNRVWKIVGSNLALSSTQLQAALDICGLFTRSFDSDFKLHIYYTKWKNSLGNFVVDETGCGNGLNDHK